MTTPRQRRFMLLLAEHWHRPSASLRDDRLALEGWRGGAHLVRLNRLAPGLERIIVDLARGDRLEIVLTSDELPPLARWTACLIAASELHAPWLLPRERVWPLDGSWREWWSSAAIESYRSWMRTLRRTAPPAGTPPARGGLRRANGEARKRGTPR